MTCPLAARTAFQHFKPPSTIDILWGQVPDIPCVEWVWIEHEFYLFLRTCMRNSWWPLAPGGVGWIRILPSRVSTKEPCRIWPTYWKPDKRRRQETRKLSCLPKRKSNNYLTNIRLKKNKKQKMSLNHVLFWLPWSLGVFSWGQQVLLLHDPTGQTWDCSTSMYDNQFQVRPCSLRKGCLVCVCAQSYPTLCNPMDHRLPGFSVHGMPV